MLLMSTRSVPPPKSIIFASNFLDNIESSWQYELEGIERVL